MSRWSITHLEDAPTLAEGPDGELKYDDGRNRLWLSRPGDRVSVDRLDEATGTWRRVAPGD